MSIAFYAARSRRSYPFSFPTKFEMAVNRRTATGLGLTIPPSILLRADEVIE
jgi:putative ABC transport system substrate-binding protein